MAATVLVIDDDLTVRNHLIEFLNNHGYGALGAATGDEALSLLGPGQVDALICELQLASGSGLDLLEKVKQENPGMPVIVMATERVMDDVIRALRLGADDYLVKPFGDQEVLLHALHKALDRARLQAENAAYRDYLEKTNTELRLHLEELRNDQLAGRQAQLRMLPEPLSFNGIDCHHRITPSLLLSGDFLDYFELTDQRLVFYLADVSGHGASSAFVTVLLKNLTYRLKRNLKRGSSDDLLYPDLVLARINSELLASELDKHLTMFYGLIDTATLTLEYSVGGHYPMPVLLSGGEASYLEGRGMPVGLFPDATYQTFRTQLPEDFRLLLFSDGILEILTDVPLIEKEQRLLTLVRDSGGDLTTLARLTGLDELPDVPDDIAMVAIGRSDV